MATCELWCEGHKGLAALRWFSGFLVVLGMVACGPGEGSAGGACSEGEVCQPGLRCVSGYCVPEEEEADEGEVNELAASLAKRAYRGALEAWNQGDAEGYLSRFVDPMDCFYKSKGFSAAKLKKKRGKAARKGASSPLLNERLRVLEVSAERVLMVDWGSWQAKKKERRFHEKFIVMRKGEGGWKIAAEVGRKSNACVDDLPEALPLPKKIEALKASLEPKVNCRSADRKCRLACLRTYCGDPSCIDTKHIGEKAGFEGCCAGNALYTCEEECKSKLRRCKRKAKKAKKG